MASAEKHHPGTLMQSLPAEVFVCAEPHSEGHSHRVGDRVTLCPSFGYQKR